MGCCFSSPGTVTHQPQTNGTTTATTIPPRNQGYQLQTLVNRPLRRHTWTAVDRTWTKAQLDQERDDFFHTRVTGSREVWEVIHAMLRELWNLDRGVTPDPSPTQTGNDTVTPSGLTLAQSLLDAGDLTVPTGNPVHGVYDARGNHYALPDWVVADPTNVVDSRTAPDLDPGENPSDESVHSDDGTINEESAVPDTSPDGNKSKGNANVAVEERTTLRARLSETGADVVISVGENEKVKSVASRILEKSKLQSRRIRLIYLGKPLKEKKSLKAQGWQQDHVVNAMVLPAK